MPMRRHAFRQIGSRRQLCLGCGFDEEPDGRNVVGHARQIEEGCGVEACSKSEDIGPECMEEEKIDPFMAALWLPTARTHSI